VSEPGGPTRTLWRPTGQAELDLVAGSGWRRWPPRLPGQPIFYPVVNVEYATRIAVEWNAAREGVGYVLAFDVARSFLDGYVTHQVGGDTIVEYWIPAEDVDALNDHLLGPIRLVSEHRAP